MKIDYIKRSMHRRMQYASYYAKNKKEMLYRFRHGYFKIPYLTLFDNNAVAASCITYFDKLSKKEKQRVIDYCWRGSFTSFKEKLFYTRKLAILNNKERK